ncbi:hypothetical protein [Spongiibacter tropicus]|uniref:hypothetical protein n=1 Tax=Spongiibacter tropicus TaxID=454602 RepID=UPI0003B384BA|nr:hypothetical protein [Spongiibacter tropicus]
MSVKQESTAQQQALVCHGLIILFLGLLSGIGFSVAAATGPNDTPLYASWRFAHMEGLLNGIAVIAIAAAWPAIYRVGKMVSVGRWALILGCYANIIGPIINALFVQKRLIVPETGLEAFIVYGFYIPGCLPMFAVPLFIVAALANRRES